ncbi:hypothetical protein Golax_000957 [Gossypium laxum]|uniref:NAC domain-containing protein n=1 Tax=Gossypium laxum TaxID=34288 RepID=A0A7J9AVP9_9ROSI|nr:hypothetical protein [Gossypium laxum]
MFSRGRSMMELESCVPPGFRFHPTEEELVGYYLRRKINSLKIDLDVIIEIDLYKMEPWDIQARCNVGNEEQSEWYFFSYKDRKYPTGTRTNRATAAGFWKATGRDKSVLSKNNIIGMRKTLEEGWVVCRAFRKPCPNQRQRFEAWSHGYYMRDNSQVRPPVSLSDIATTSHLHLRRNQGSSFYESYGSEQELVSNTHNFLDSQQVIELPQLDSPITVSPSLAEKEVFHCDEEKSNESSQIHVIDWKNFDNLFNSQLTDTTSYPYQTAALIPQNDELEAQQHHLLGCFPGS